MPETSKNWYVLRAISGKESKVKEYIDQAVANTPLGQHVYQVLIPTEKVYQQRNGKKVLKEKPYLPGYVLVEAELVGEVPHVLRNVPNVQPFCHPFTRIRSVGMTGVLLIWAFCRVLCNLLDQADSLWKFDKKLPGQSKPPEASVWFRFHIGNRYFV